MSTSAPEITTELNFYASPLCPYCHRVWMILLEKNTPFNFVNIDLRDKPDWFLELNPPGSVPVFAYKDPEGTHIINESLTLMFFLEDYQPTPTTLPASPAARAQARNIISFFGDKVTAPFYRTLRSLDKEACVAGSQDLTAALSQLESKMSPEGPYFMGKEFTLVDAAVLPWLLRMPVLKYYRGFDALQGLPKLKAYAEACKERDSVKGSMVVPTGPWEEELIKFFGRQAGSAVDYFSATL